MADNTVIYTKKEHVAYVTLNRPEADNIINQRLAQEMDDIYSGINQDGEYERHYLRFFDGHADVPECLDFSVVRIDITDFQHSSVLPGRLPRPARCRRFPEASPRLSSGRDGVP